jgi:gliding motility-associated lipoprotein GldD
MNKRILPVFFFIAILLIACNSAYQPEIKRKGYFKITFPEKSYKLFDQPGYPYKFEYPAYATISRDTSFFGEATENPWWLNIDILQFGARIYVSYKDVTRSNFDSLVNDGFKMAYKQHSEVATGIDPERITTPHGIEGLYFSLKGNTATANQFFLSDSTRHFLRGSMYIYATPNEDSLGIVNDFLKKDLEHLINTLEWK